MTDLAELFRLGTAKAEENVDFRRYLHAHHIPDDRFPILAAEVQPRIDCTACANCCRYSVVAVTQADIEVLAGHLGITSDDVIHNYTVADPDDSTRRILRSTSDGCVFLRGNLCSIYKARPRICRDFPHITAGLHTLGARLSSHARWAPLCPIVYNALEAFKHLTGYHPHVNHGGAVR